jgi:hypothetical protein
MRKLLLFLFLIMSAGTISRAGDRSSTLAAAPQTPAAQPGRNLWRCSLVALAVSNGLDVHSSWGKRELNSNLAGPDTTFGRKGALIKLGIQGGVFALECLVLRHRGSPRLYRSLALINFGDAAATAAVSAHNYSVPRR